ncbi:Phage integrase family protein [Marinobacter sp. es.048]|uniref:tyrosine-type recombinase/integrase n=1 Tax=Marinobacter sp. es.048 TaxID=1761795 RepID=UPI000B591672|nr:tyrosine-type recombinase/integrase [Marinobacter sp. es.048]SNC62548.1 Phage integrase family protein [Marinobacter sp. es.048]
MGTVTGAEVLADRERLLKALPRGEGLHGIVTTDRAESVLYVLSRYENDVWWLSKSKETGNSVDNKRKLDFTRISGEQLRAEAKVVMARLIWAENALANATIRQHFHNLVLWLNWLHDQGIRSHTQVTPLVAFRYVQYVRRLTSPTKPGTPLGGQAKFYKLSAVERCWQDLRDTASGFDHPWPDSTATALAEWKQGVKKAKTEIIPDDVLKTLFQLAESLLRQANDLLAHRDAVAAYQPRSKDRSHQRKEKSRFLKTRGWDQGLGALRKTLRDLRDGCFVIILATTGIRAHELGLIHRDEWFSEVRDGERFYFLVSRSDKTHAGKTSWLCPKIAIDAVKALERLSAPLQRDLESALEAAKGAEDLKEITHLRSISGAVGLTKVSAQKNRLYRLSSKSLYAVLKNFAKTLGLDWNLTSHQFRRTFANYAVHHKLGDLRYLRDHFKHWSLDMTILYAMNENQDLELYDEIYAAFDGKRQAIVGHWLEPDTPLSGGMAGHIRQMRGRTQEARTYKDRREMVEAISELVFLRSTGIAWCTNDTGVDCAGGQCEDCEHGCIDDTHKPFWEGLYLQQIELLQIDDLTDSGSKTVERTMERCERVLTDLGVDINRLKEQVTDVELT